MRALNLCRPAFLVLTVVLTAHCASNSGRIVERLPDGIDLAQAKSVEVRDGNGSAVLRGSFANDKAPLAGAGTDATGLAEIETKRTASAYKQELEVGVKNLPPSASFTLTVDGKEVATFQTSAAGKRSMKYSRKDASR